MYLLLAFRYEQFRRRGSYYSEREEKNTVLFFLPEMPVKLYAGMMVSVAEAIRQRGFETVFFGCNGFLNNCLLQDRLSFRSKIFKNAMVCAQCHVARADASNKHNLNYLECSHFGNQNGSFADNTLDDRLAYFYKGIPVGQLAYYDLSIKFKRDRARQELSPKEILYYDAAISDGKRIVDFLEQNKSSLNLNAVISIDEYSLANIVREWARINAISAFRAGFSYHFNADPQFVTLSQTKTRAGEKYDRVIKWKMWREIPLPASVIHEITADLIFRMSGSGGHIFSSNYTGDIDDLLERYNLRREVKTFVVFTSANDEMNAISELTTALGEQFKVQDAFENQVDWLEAIVAHARKENVQVIIKMHPRLAKSHRDSGIAEDIYLYESLAASSPSNVVFIWPEENISAYDILQLADYCLTSWGTMGLEASKLGVPVITGITKITFVTPDFSLFTKAKSEAQFYRLMEKPEHNIGFNEIAEAFRWHHLLNMSGAVVIEGDRDLNLYGEEFICDFPDVLVGADIEEMKREFLLSRAAKDVAFVEQEERDAIFAAIKTLISFFELNTKANSLNSKLVNRLRSIQGQS